MSIRATRAVVSVPAATPPGSTPNASSTASSTLSWSSPAVTVMVAVCCSTAKLSAPSLTPASAKSPASVVPTGAGSIGTRSSSAGGALSATTTVTPVPPSCAVNGPGANVTASIAVSPYPGGDHGPDSPPPLARTCTSYRLPDASARSVALVLVAPVAPSVNPGAPTSR